MNPLYQYTNRELYVICQLLKIDRVSEYNTKDVFVEAIKNKSDKALAGVVAELRRQKDKEYIIMGYCGRSFNENSCLDGNYVTYHYYTNDDNFRLKPEGKLGYYSLRKQIVSTIKCETCHKNIVYKGGYINNFKNVYAVLLAKQIPQCIQPKKSVTERTYPVENIVLPPKKIAPKKIYPVENIVLPPKKIAPKKIYPVENIVLSPIKGIPKKTFPVEISISQKPIQTDATFISKKRREEVWNEWIGAEIGVINCLLCDKVRIQQGACNGWDCGHVISRKKDGDTSIANLRPICKGCNSSMSDINMADWCLKEYPNSKILGTLTNANNVDKKTKLHTNAAVKRENQVEIDVYLHSFTREELRELCSLLGVQHGGQLYQGTSSTKQSIIDKIIKFENNTSNIIKYAKQIRSQTEEKSLLNGYHLFSAENRDEVKAKLTSDPSYREYVGPSGEKKTIENAEPKFTDIAKKIASLWRGLSDKEKAEWSEKAKNQPPPKSIALDTLVANKKKEIEKQALLNEIIMIDFTNHSGTKLSYAKVNRALFDKTSKTFYGVLDDDNETINKLTPHIVQFIEAHGGTAIAEDQKLIEEDHIKKNEDVLYHLLAEKEEKENLKIEEHQTQTKPLPSIPALNKCIECKTKEPNVGYKYCQTCYENRAKCMVCGINKSNRSYKYCQKCYENKLHGDKEIL